MTVGMRGAGASYVGHGGMMGVFILRGAGAYGILIDREAVGTLGGEGAVCTGNLGGISGRPDQRIIGGMVGVPGLGTGRTI